MQAFSGSIDQLPLWVLTFLAALGLLLMWRVLRAAAARIFGFDSRMDDLLSQKKSSEVRLGKIAEVLSPVLDDFPVDVHKPGTSTVFLGQPVDFVHFDPEEGVTFIEVKSGNSRLKANQKAIKEHVQNGNVRWEDFRVKGR